MISPVCKALYVICCIESLLCAPKTCESVYTIPCICLKRKQPNLFTLLFFVGIYLSRYCCCHCHCHYNCCFYYDELHFHCSLMLLSLHFCLFCLFVGDCLSVSISFAQCHDVISRVKSRNSCEDCRCWWPCC